MPTQEILAHRAQQWSAHVIQTRQETLGARYMRKATTLGFTQKMSAMVDRGIELANFEALKSGLSSGITFGVRGGISKSLQDLGSSRIRAGAIAGIPMALSNLLVEQWVIGPMTRAQKDVGHPTLVAIKPEVLFPSPNPVRVVTDASGFIRYEEKSPLEITTEKNEVRLKRENVTRWQNRASCKGLGSQLVPLGIGVLNAARRGIHNDPIGAIAGLEIAAASAVGAGLFKGALTLMQAGLFVDVNSPQGDTQTLPLFVVKQTKPVVNDGQAVPGLWGQTARHSWKAAKAMVLSPLETLTEALVTNMIPNVMASMAGETLGEAAGEALGKAAFRRGSRPAWGTQMASQALQSYATAFFFRSGKNASQVPEQHDFQGDMQTRTELKKFRVDQAQTETADAQMP
jgi:hypothetical protein